MRFESLEDAETAFRALDGDLTTAYTILRAYSIVFSSLIATHPDYRQLQLHLTSALEGPGLRVLGENLDDKQIDALRTVVESLQQIKQMSGRIDPLAGLRKS